MSDKLEKAVKGFRNLTTSTSNLITMAEAYVELIDSGKLEDAENWAKRIDDITQSFASRTERLRVMLGLARELLSDELSDNYYANSLVDEIDASGEALGPTPKGGAK